MIVAVLLACGGPALADDAGSPRGDNLDEFSRHDAPVLPITPTLAGRIEVSAGLATTSTPFIRQHGVVGTAALHWTDRVAFRLDGTWFADFGESDWRPVTQHFTERAMRVDTDKLSGVVDLSGEVAPVTGKLRVPGGVVRIGMYGLFGAGAMRLSPDSLTPQCTSPCAASTPSWVGAASIGGGFRLWSGAHIVRVELRDRVRAVLPDAGSARQLRHQGMASVSYGGVFRTRKPAHRRVRLSSGATSRASGSSAGGDRPGS